MSLFQKPVEKKYLSELDKALIDKKFAEFQEYFGNAAIQENIRNAKEEQFQEGFLRELFVKIFDYTLNPQPNFNLTTELKNISNSKKADGAILRGENAIAVIELKSTDTTDLTTVEAQAFGYKNHHPKCVYVITSNFEKLRFYIQNAVYHLEFDLFKLSKEDFSIMWLCLAKDSLLKDLPLKIKESSVVQEENITKLLYSDYSKFREAIFRNLVENNPEIDKLLLFKKTQKLIDRFLFIFFAEDKQLLPPNSINEIVQQWDELKDKYDEYFPLYDRFKKYFGYLNTGYVGKKYSIYAYNGGLFTPDEILDNISIDDNILREHTLKLSNYDFDTDVDVNILGHIFEHSLGEIENVEAEIKGEKVEQEKTRRKKDGIFYTPKYITKYIVENTIGKLCDEKRIEFEIVDEEYAKGRKNRKKETIKVLDEKLKKYREWLLSLTILDPACGSGAFLNQALEFLIAEHKKIDELNAQLFGAGLVFSDITTDILEKNIFGVDLNEESVEIAKLSLWLRTAQKGRKLNTLSNNIKCGNSLIDDPEIAGEKAFNWQNEFPAIFAKGGFDVVIGNPPYVHLESMKEVSNALSKMNYETFDKRGDLYGLFVEQGFRISKNGGLISYIMPNKWLQAGYGKPLREFFLKYRLDQLIDFGDIQIFEGATTYPCIFISRKANPQKVFAVSVLNEANKNDFYLNVNQTSELFEVSNFSGDTWVISSNNEQNLIEQLKKNFKPLSEYVGGEAYYGIKTGLTEAFLIDEETKAELIIEDEKSSKIIKPFLQGRDVKAYFTPTINSYLLLIEKGFTKTNYGSLLEEHKAWERFENNYPSIAKWLQPFEERGKNRTDKGDYWWEIRACDYYTVFSKPKIMYQAFQVKPCFIYDESGLFCNNSMWFIPTLDKGLLAVLNSKLGWWLITKYCTQIQNGVQLIWKYFGQIPIAETTKELSEKAELMLLLNKNLQEISEKFQRSIIRKLDLKELPNKLANWYLISYKEFIKELNKKKITFSLSEEADWEKYFNEESKKALDTKALINITEKEIDKLVYNTYGLTEDEIKIVEESM